MLGQFFAMFVYLRVAWGATWQGSRVEAGVDDKIVGLRAQQPTQ